MPPDGILYMPPKPESVAIGDGRITWRFAELTLAIEGGGIASFPISRAEPYELLAEGRGRIRRPRYDAMVNADLARLALDKLAAVSRWGRFGSRGLAEGLARDVGLPISLCGICRQRHVRDQGGWRRENDRGVEMLSDWVELAAFVNAVRRTMVRIRDGRGILDEDLHWIYGPRPLAMPTDPDAPPTQMPWGDHRDPVRVVRQIHETVNDWLSATCVTPAVKRPRDAAFEFSGRPFVLIGSELALIGWALRQEFSTDDDRVRICEGGPEYGATLGCGITWSLQRRRVDSEGRKRRRLCDGCDGVYRSARSRGRTQKGVQGNG